MTRPAVQFPLALRDFDRSTLAAIRVREALRKVAHGIGHKNLGDDWKCGEHNASNKIEDRGRQRLHLDEILDLFLRDRDLLILQALCDEAGCEPPERKRVLEPAEKLERLQEAIGELFGPEVVELALRKARLL